MPARSAGSQMSRRTTSAEHVPSFVMRQAGNSIKFSFYRDTSACKRQSVTSVVHNGCVTRSMTASAWNQNCQRRRDQDRFTKQDLGAPLKHCGVDRVLPPRIGARQFTA